LAFIVLVSPALIWFLGLMIWPILNMFYVSTLQWNGLLRPQVYVGLENYIRLLSDDPRFFQALRNTGLHWLIGLPTAMSLAFMLGFFLSLRQPGHRILRVIFFSPVMISAAGASLMFTGVYMPEGILNTLLRMFQLEHLTRLWLGDPSVALYAIIGADTWASIGFQSMLFFAVLSGIPKELYEAAQIDGANYWTIMWRIAFPMVIDTLGVLMMLRTLWILLGSAQIVLLLTQGGPGNATLTLGYYLYQEAFQTQRLGYSQAIAVFAFAIGIISILVIRRVTRRSYQAEERIS
jgi:multiple sugar transport system permease protein